MLQVDWLKNPSILPPKQEVKTAHQQKQQGLTLIELAVVVSILAITAVIVLPDLSSNDHFKLDSATTELVAAIRFARSEAIRTGIPHGIYSSASSDKIKVYSNPSIFPSYNVYHPIDKKLYTLQYNTNASYPGIDLSNASFSFNGSFSSSNYLGFSIAGIPKYTAGFPTKDYMLVSGSITLTHNGNKKTVSISPMTGRVTIQ